MSIISKNKILGSSTGFSTTPQIDWSYTHDLQKRSLRVVFLRFENHKSDLHVESHPKSKAPQNLLILKPTSVDVLTDI